MQRLAALAVVAALISPNSASEQNDTFRDWARDQAYSPGNATPGGVDTNLSFPAVDFINRAARRDRIVTPAPQMAFVVASLLKWVSAILMWMFILAIPIGCLLLLILEVIKVQGSEISRELALAPGLPVGGPILGIVSHYAEQGESFAFAKLLFLLYDCEVESHLQALRELRVVRDADPSTREGELLEEMDGLEYESGLLYSGEEGR